MAKKRVQNSRRIIIRDEKHGLPYSKGLMASSIMATGLPPSRSYQVARQIEDRLLTGRKHSVSIPELRRVTLEILRDTVGEEYAEKFQKWQALSKLDKPMVILIGGTTGVGKSTIATQLAARLGIVRVVATDAIREVMRSMLSSELMPTLHTSSFHADQALREPPGTTSDALLLGFREQTAAVAVGINALIERAATEGTSIVIEGAHIVPGFVDLESHHDRILGVPFILGVEDEGRHLSHFATREDAVASRPAERYAAGFDNIRRLQRYVKSQALSHGVPVLPNYSFDQAIAAVMDLVMEHTTQRAAEIREAAQGGSEHSHGAPHDHDANPAGDRAGDPVGGQTA